MSSITLTIYRKDDINIVDFSESNTLIPRCEIAVEGNLINELTAEISRTMAKTKCSHLHKISKNEEVTGELKRLGSILYQQLVPEKARQFLIASNESNLYLRIDDKLIHVPWELCYDGQMFLGMKFQIGRQVITEHKSKPWRSTIRSHNNDIGILLVADPTETLEGASKEVERLANYFDGIQGLQVSILGGRQVTKTALLKDLGEYEIIHFAGHSDFDQKDPGKSGWMLYDGKLTSSEIRKLDKAPSLIFSNSCQSGETVPWDDTNRVEDSSFGIGSSFLVAGVKNYIGTSWWLHDEDSANFSLSFYRNVIKGTTIGEALLNAKNNSINRSGWNNLVWAQYSLYGDPTNKYLSGSGSKTKKGSVIAFLKLPSRLLGILLIAIASIIFAHIFIIPHEKQLKQNTSYLDRKDKTSQQKRLKHDKNVLSPDESKFLMAYDYFRNGKINLAMKYFQDLSNESDAYAKSMGTAGSAMIYFEGGSLDKAKSYISKAIQEKPENPFARLIHGDILFSEGDLEGATSDYLSVKTGFKSVVAEAMNAAGVLLWMQGEKNKAMGIFNRSLEIAPGNRDSSLNLGISHFANGKIAKAVDILSRIQRLNFADSESQHFLEKAKNNSFHKIDPRGKRNLIILPFQIAGGNIRTLGIGETLSGHLVDLLNENAIDVSNYSELGQISIYGVTEKMALQGEATEIGKKLGFQFVAYGNMKKYYNVIYLDIFLIRVSDGSLFLTKSIQVEKKPLIENAAEKSAKLISSALSHPLLE